MSNDDFGPLVEAQLRGATVRAAPLVLFNFKSGVKRYWPGFGSLEAAQQQWNGIGNLGALSPISAGISGVVDEMTFSLFGDERILQNLIEDADETAGQIVKVYLQFFDLRRKDGDGNWVEWQTLEDPIQIFNGRMGPLMPSMTPPEGNDRRTRVLTVQAQNAFINRARPRFAMFSDRDQKARTGGTDNIFINVALYIEGTTRWPRF